MATTNALAYMRNVGKSLGYSFVDTVAANNPTVTAIFKSSKELSSSLYQSIKDVSAKKQDFDHSELKSSINDLIGDTKKNLFSDLKSGNWYNKQRIKTAEDAAANAMFGMDDDWDLENWDFENDTEAEAKIQESSTKEITASMDTTGAKTANAISTATVRSADYIVESSRLNTKAIYNMTSQGFNKVMTGMGALNANVQTLVEFGKPLTQHMQNSALFYAKTTEYQEKSLKLLEQIANNTAPKSPQAKRSGGKYTLSDILSSDGTIDFSAMSSQLKKQMKEYTELITSFAGMAGGFDGIIGMAKSKTASPLQFPLMMMWNALMGPQLRGSMKSFNKALQGFAGGAMSRLRGHSFGANGSIIGSLIDVLKDAILPKTTMSKTPNLANYEKGKVDWDGKSRKALMEVIPYQLARIVSALTGEDDLDVFDYDRGRFVKKKSLDAQMRRQRRNSAKSAGGDLFDTIGSSVDRMRSMSDRDKKIYKEKLETFLENAMMSGDDAWLNFMKSGFDWSKYGIDARTGRDIAKRARAISRTSQGRGMAASLAGDMEYARGQHNRTMEGYGDNVFVNAFINGEETKKASTLLGVDPLNKDNDIWHYLRGIYEYTGALAVNIPLFIPGADIRHGDKVEIASVDATEHRRRQPVPKNAKMMRELSTGATGGRYDGVGTGGLGSRSDFDDSINEALSGENLDQFLTPEQKKYLSKKAVGGDDFTIDPKIEAEIANVRRAGGTAKAAAAKVTSLKDRLKSKYGSSKHPIIAKMQDTYGLTIAAVSKMFDTAGDTINNVIYGIDASGASASMGKIVGEGLRGIFSPIAQLVDAFIPKGMQDAIRNLWGKFWGSGFGKSIKGAFGDAGKWLAGKGLGAVGDFVGGLVSDRQSRQDRMSNLSTGAAPVAEDTGASGSGLWGIGAGNASRLNFSNKAKGKARTKYLTNDAKMNISMSGYIENILHKFIDKLGGENGESNKKIKGLVSGIIQDAGDAKGAMGAGAIIGAGTSLLTGAFVGPILGAGIGAATGLAIKSGKVQKALFGEMGEDGKRDGTGLIPKSWIDKIYSVLPGLKDKAKRAGAGAGIGLLLGPFGIPGNIIVGAAVGLASETEGFKKWMFGEEQEGPDGKKRRMGGFKDTIIGIFDKVGNIVAQAGRNMFLTLTEKLTGIVKGIFSHFKAGTFIGDLLKSMGGGLKGLGGKLAYAARRPFEGLNTALEKTALRGGSRYRIRGADGQWHYASASQRTARRNALGIYSGNARNKSLEIDRLLSATANLGDLETDINKAIEGGEDFDVTKFTNDAQVIKALNGRLSKSNLRNFRDQLKIEQQYRERTGDKAVKPLEEVVPSKMDAITATLTNIYNHIKYGPDAPEVTAQDVANEKNGKKKVHISGNSQKKGLGALSTGANAQPQEGDTRTITDALGNEKMQIYQNGNWVDYEGAATTNKSQSTTAKLLDGMGSLPLIGPAIEKLSGIASNIHDALFDKGPEKKGFFSKLIDAFTGENGILGGMIKWFSGIPLVGALSKLPSALGGIPGGLGLGLVAAGLGGVFDNAGERIGLLDFFRNTDGTSAFGNRTTTINNTTTNNNGVQLPGLPQVVGSDNRISSMLKRQTGIRLLTGGKSIVSGALGKTGIGKAIAKGAGDLIKNGAGAGAVKAVVSAINSGAANLAVVLTKLPFVNISDDVALDIAEKIATTGTKAAESMGAKAGAILGKLGKALAVVRIVWVVEKAVDGFTDAANILGIAQEPSIGQKVIAGLVSAVNAAIPFIGDLIPNNVLVNMFMSIAPKLGIDVSDLQTQRDRAASDLAAYNAQNEGEDIDLEEYNRRGLTRDANGNFVEGKSRIGINKRIRNAGRSFIASVKENGLGTTLKNTKVGSVVSAGLSRVGSGIKSAAEKTKNAFQQFMAGEKQLFELVKAGDVKGLIASQYPEDPGNPSNGVMVGLYNIRKMMNVPIALQSLVGHKMAGFFKGIVTGVKTFVGRYNEQKAVVDNILSESSESSMTESIAKLLHVDKSTYDESNPYSPLFVGISVGERMMYLPQALIKMLGNNLKNSVKEKIDAIKSSTGSLVQGMLEHDEFTKAGDVSGLLSSSYEAPEDGIASGLFGLTHGISKIGHLPFAGISWVGHKLFDSVKESIDKTRDVFGTVIKAFDDMKDASANGDMTQLRTVAESHISAADSPLARLFIGFGHTFFAVVTGVRKLVKPVKEGLEWLGDKTDGLKEGAKNAWENAKTTAVNIYRGATGQSAVGGSGSGVISQLDSRFAGARVGGRSFADNGCGPATAMMALGGVGRGSSMGDAISVANRYQTTGGTDASYFGEMFARNGVSANYHSSIGSAARSIAAGRPTVLMGQDVSNRSKAGSPFGPHNHYVVANGIDSSGRVVVQDPESRGIRRYSPRILGNVKMAVSAGRSGLYIPWFGMGGGRTVEGATSADVGGTAAKATGGTGKPMTAKNCYNENLGIWSELTAEEINSWLNTKAPSDSPFRGQGAVFVRAGKESGLDPRYIVAHAAVESGWGKSNMALTKNNYFGIGAFDTNPSAAYTFADGLEAGIVQGANWISKHYYNGKYEQTSVYRMRYNNGVHQYCTSETWVESIGKIMASAPPNTKLTTVDEVSAPSVGAIPDVGSGQMSNASAVESGGSEGGESKGFLSTVLGAFSKIQQALMGGFTKGGSSEAGVGSAEDGGDQDSSASKLSEYNPSNLINGGDPVDYMKSKLGALKYSMNGPRDPDKGSADCSSTVRWAIQKATQGAINLPGTSRSQFNDPNLMTVVDAKGQDITTLPANIARNDLMFFKRKWSAGMQPYGVGHVGLYVGNGQYIDHGSTPGTKLKTFTGKEQLTKVARLRDYTWTRNGELSPNIDDNKLANVERRMARMDGGSGSLLLNADLSRYGYGAGASGLGFAGGNTLATGSILGGQSLDSIATKAPQISKDTAAALKVIIELVIQLVKNTQQVDGIYEILKANIGSLGTAEMGNIVDSHLGGEGAGGSHHRKRSLHTSMAGLEELRGIMDQVLAG